MIAEAAWVAPLGRLGLALVIRFLAGIERGRKRRDEHDGARAAGVRTFALSGLLGGLAGLGLPIVGPIPIAVILLTFGAALGCLNTCERKQKATIPQQQPSPV